MSQEKSGESACRFQVRFKCNRGLNCDTMLTKLDWPCLGASLGILPETRMEQFDLSREFSSTIDPRRQFTVPRFRTQPHLVSKRPSYYCLIHLVSKRPSYSCLIRFKKCVYQVRFGSLLTREFARGGCLKRPSYYCLIHFKKGCVSSIAWQSADLWVRSEWVSV